MAVRLGRAAGWQEEPPLWPSPSPELAPWLALVFLASVPLPMWVGRGQGSWHALLLPLEGPCHPWANARPASWGRAMQRAAAQHRPSSLPGYTPSPGTELLLTSRLRSEVTTWTSGGISWAPCLSWGPHRGLLEPSTFLPPAARSMFWWLVVSKAVSPSTTASSLVSAGCSLQDAQSHGGILWSPGHLQHWGCLLCPCWAHGFLSGPAAPGAGLAMRHLRSFPLSRRDGRPRRSESQGLCRG